MLDSPECLNVEQMKLDISLDETKVPEYFFIESGEKKREALWLHNDVKSVDIQFINNANLLYNFDELWLSENGFSFQLLDYDKLLEKISNEVFLVNDIVLNIDSWEEDYKSYTFSYDEFLNAKITNDLFEIKNNDGIIVFQCVKTSPKQDIYYKG